MAEKEKKKEVAKAQPYAPVFEEMAGRLGVKVGELPVILKKTVCRDDKMTNEQFIAFLIVANKYKLDPLTREIYAFPDKREGIVPIVSTDGWNRLMTTHPNYKGHVYVYSENIVELKDAHPCPEWCEVHIEKKDGGKIVVREYFEEVYREPFKKEGRVIKGPWQTHTKRMMRHKTKIQGAREAFGFGGVYDKDEAERIVEQQEREIIETVATAPQLEPEQVTDQSQEQKPGGGVAEQQ